jgi:sulfatase maturation enzyme AslB (radical SAM superfamily)
MDVSTHSLMKEALQAHSTGKLARAKELYESILQDDPHDQDAMSLLSVLDAKLEIFDNHLGDQSIQSKLQAIAKMRDISPIDRNYYLAYQSWIELIRRSHYFEYPRSIHIETLASCNATCTFCPYTELDRIGTRMPDSLIEKIINDLSEIPTSIPFTICPFKVSDPFLEKRLPEIISDIHGRLPSANIWIATNGSALTEKNARKFEAAARRPISISISLNEYRADAYQKIMGLNFERTVANLKMLHDLAGHGEFSHPVWIGRVSSTEAEDFAFMRWVRKELPNFGIMIKGAGNWIGNVTSRTRDVVMPIGCSHWFEVSIMATGKLALCCMDAKGDIELGNVAEQSILEIYNAPAHRAFREHAKTRLDVAPCSRCTYPETAGRQLRASDALPSDEMIA